MNPIVLEIPDDPAELPAWLERHLVGLDLAALVAELSSVHDATPPRSPTLEEILGPSRAAVLAEGLSALPDDRLRRLLRHPRRLLDLQELVATSGGPYWSTAGLASESHRDAVDRGRRRLEAWLATEAPSTGDRPEFLTAIRRVPWYRTPWAASLATAASLLIAFAAYERVKTASQTPEVATSTAWGWSRPDALPQDLPSSAYLDRLADLAGEWFARRPADAPALARRIGELRQGCSTLLLAPHRPLPVDDRSWLVERCRAWATSFDRHLAAVEAGEDPAKVRDETDATVRTLVDALRARAKGVS